MTNKIISPSALAQKVRRHVIEMTHCGNSSHVASALSIIDVVAVLYGKVMRYDVKNPKNLDRDRFILSKGHAGATIYATLAEVGFFPKERLKEHCQNGSYLSGHVSHKEIPGVELSTGALGHGLPVGAGIAYAGKLKQAAYKVYVILSDGECDEGSNWEAILFAAHHKLNNLVVIIDYNKLQSMDTISATLALEPLRDKFTSFNWDVIDVDGHDPEILEKTFSNISINIKPTCIIAHTIKGKGISFMENQVLWHYRSPQGQDYVNALAELDPPL
jgi:transketolase